MAFEIKFSKICWPIKPVAIARAKVGMILVVVAGLELEMSSRLHWSIVKRITSSGTLDCDGVTLASFSTSLNGKNW